MKNRKFHIKRIISLLTSMLILINTLLPINAKSSKKITESEAKTLIFNALNLFHNVHWALDSIHFDSTNIIIDEHGEYYFALNEENLPGGSYEAMKEYAKSIYIDEVAPNMYEHNRSFFHTKPTFLITQEGKIGIFTPLYSANVLNWGCGIKDWSNYSQKDMTAKLVNSDEQNAVMWLKIRYGNEVESSYYWIECKMINTTAGWRIEESPFTLMLEWGESGYSLWKDGLVPFEESPSTADPATERVALLGAVSLACLIPAACLTIKRRRRVAAD